MPGSRWHRGSRARSIIVLLTVTASFRPATDLGYLLHKNPAHAQTFELRHGAAHVFYPEVSDDRCTVALLLEVDPVGLIRGRRGRAAESFALGQYVNDRPYAASSLLSVAIGRVFRTALTGACKARPRAGQITAPAHGAPLRAAVPGRRRAAAPSLRAARLRRQGDPARARRALPGVG